MNLNITNLRESIEFLNILFEKIPSVVMLVDKDLVVQEVNDAYQVIFGLPREQAVGQRCGNALKCAFAVTEETLCGETSNCEQCLLRQAAIQTLLQQVPADQEKLVHTFFINGSIQERHFEFSTRYVTFHGEQMVLVILYDVTKIEVQKLELIDKQSKLDESLKAAGIVQLSLLPKKLPHVKTVDFSWKFIPCEGIGGDILNVIHLDEDNIGLYMLDVAGHGAPSAMISVLVYQLMNSQTGFLLDNTTTPPSIRKPEEVLNLLDKEFPLMRFKRHFTIVYAVLNHHTGSLTYSNAAHCSPIVLTQDGCIKTLDVSGTVIGISAMPFGQQTIILSPGDKVVLFSDGVEEMGNADSELFGSERLAKSLIALRDTSTDALVQGIYEQVMHFAGGHPPVDDLSILAFEYKGTTSSV